MISPCIPASVLLPLVILMAALLILTIDGRQRRAKLQQLADRLHTLLTAIPHIVYFKDAEGRYLLANRAFERFANTDLDQIIGKTDSELLPEEIGRACRSSDEDVLQKGESACHEETMITPSGDEVVFQTTKNPIKDPTGKIIGLVGISRDITPQHIAEVRTKKSEARYRAMVEDMPALVCRFQPGGVLTFVNDAYCECFRTRREELLGECFLELVPEEDQKIVSDILDGLSREKPAACYEHRAVLPDGRVVWQRWIDRALFNEEGEIIEYQAIGMDITDSKRAQDWLEQSHDELQQLAARLQTVREEQNKRIARIIHDELGQALTAVKMNATWLKKNLSEQPAARKRAEDMENLIDLVIREVQSITMQLRPTMLDHLGLPAAMGWVVEDFENRSGIRTDLDIDVDFDIRDECAIGLFRITQELLTNIARHAKATHAEVTLRPIADMLVLRICDNGVGMPESAIGNPTSFGLIELKERSVQMGGTTRIQSTPNGGTEVTVSIPICEAVNSHD